jgi:hypothetical protein
MVSQYPNPSLLPMIHYEVGVIPLPNFFPKIVSWYQKLLILRSLKLLHASQIVAHHINPCSAISNAPLVHSQQIPSCPIFMHHAPIRRPLAVLSQTIAEIFL